MQPLSGHLWRPITAEWYCNDWRTGRKKRRENIENHTETLLSRRGSFLVATRVVFLFGFLFFYCICLCSLLLLLLPRILPSSSAPSVSFSSNFFSILSLPSLAVPSVPVCFALGRRRKLATGGQWQEMAEDEDDQVKMLLIDWCRWDLSLPHEEEASRGPPTLSSAFVRVIVRRAPV